MPRIVLLDRHRDRLGRQQQDIAIADSVLLQRDRLVKHGAIGPRQYPPIVETRFPAARQVDDARQEFAEFASRGQGEIDRLRPFSVVGVHRYPTQS
ncbi:hypothetical protein MAGR_34200 [Mycolicibacterium agri]|uniref:Uncharacterized protein n=1 Tax=Mycolicibacterium agri TaxID=36811 RepID=A0A7I9W3M5_MYCAG|nr:hypothetical protein MAGR_34200 [Mycolicibacterium agri]